MKLSTEMLMIFASVNIINTLLKKAKSKMSVLELHLVKKGEAVSIGQLMPVRMLTISVLSFNKKIQEKDTTTQDMSKNATNYSLLSFQRLL